MLQLPTAAPVDPGLELELEHAAPMLQIVAKTKTTPSDRRFIMTLSIACEWLGTPETRSAGPIARRALHVLLLLSQWEPFTHENPPKLSRHAAPISAVRVHFAGGSAAVVDGQKRPSFTSQTKVCGGVAPLEVVPYVTLPSSVP